MRQKILFTTLGLTLISGTVFAQAARDWHNFHKFHEHLNVAIHEVEIARQANQAAVSGRSGKTEDFLRQAENALRLANGSTNNN